MSNFEKFGLFSGILGVIVDTFAIIGYISGLINFGSPNTQAFSNNHPPVLFILTLAIIIIYSWISISWVLTKRAVTNLESAKKKYDLDKIVTRIVIGVGLVIVPMIFGWLVVTQSGGISEVSDARKKAIIYATQTAQVLEIPAYATRIAQTQEAGGNIVIQESVDALEQRINRIEMSDAPFIYVFGLPIISVILGFLVHGIIYQLLPIVHTEILKDNDIK